MFPLSLRVKEPECPLLDRLPLSVRNLIYASLIQASPKQTSAFRALSLTCHQINEEFTESYNYHVHGRFRCCLGRTAQDHDTTRFYTWNYHTTPWGGPITITPSFVSNLKECTVRCTIEELGAFERHSEVGNDAFKDCLRLLAQSFRNCEKMRELHIELDHFVLKGKNGLPGPKEVVERVKKLFDLPGARSVTVVNTWGERMKWVPGGEETKKGKGKRVEARENWTLEKQKSNGPRREKAPRGYSQRRGIT